MSRGRWVVASCIVVGLLMLPSEEKMGSEARKRRNARKRARRQGVSPVTTKAGVLDESIQVTLLNRLKNGEISGLEYQMLLNEHTKSAMKVPTSKPTPSSSLNVLKKPETTQDGIPTDLSHIPERMRKQLKMEYEAEIITLDQYKNIISQYPKPFKHIQPLSTGPESKFSPRHAKSRMKKELGLDGQDFWQNRLSKEKSNPPPPSLAPTPRPSSGRGGYPAEYYSHPSGGGDMPKIFQEFMVGYNISVELKCNIVVSGILEAVDTLLNMQMSNATYHIIPDNEIDPMCKPMGPLEDKDTPLKVVKKIRQMAATRQPRIFIRGNHVRNIRIPEEVPLDSVTLVKAMGIADAEAHLEREKNLSITHNESISFLHWHNARNIDDDLARAEERLERKLLRKKDLEVPKEEIRKKLIDKHKLRLAQPFQYYRSEDGELKDRSPSPMLSWVPRDFDDMIDPNITFANFTNPYLTDEERNSINEIQTRNRKEWEEAEWGPMDIFERKFFSIPTDGSLYRNMNISYSDVEKLDTTGYDPAYDVILKMKR